MSNDVALRLTQALIDKSAMDDLESYLTRGRLLQSLSDEALVQAYIATLKRWAADVRDGDAARAMTDASSEMRLRSLEPPQEPRGNAHTRAECEGRRSIGT
jgi:hypothetical protein